MNTYNKLNYFYIYQTKLHTIKYLYLEAIMSAIASKTHNTTDDEDAGKQPAKKKRRISFNPIALRRQPSNENGEYDVTSEPIRPAKEPQTDEQIEESLKKEDINYVFLHVLSFWHENRKESEVEINIRKYAGKRAVLEARNDREIYRATHEDLLVLCLKLLTQLEAGKRVTLSGKAGRMMVEPVQESETTDINDVRTLIDYLNMMTVKLEF